jgi:hypothetical protein
VDTARQVLELSRAFVDQKSSKRIQAKGTAILEVKDIDTRALAK